MIRKAFAFLKRVYVAGASWALAFLALLAAILFATGTLTGARVRDAVSVLRGKRPAAPTPPPVDLTEAQIRLDLERRNFEEKSRKRESDLQSLDDRVRDNLARVKDQTEKLEKARKDAEEAAAALKRDQIAAADAKFAQELELNLPIFSRMDGAGVLGLMKGWDDARIVKYLRAMRPTKAAEVLEAMQTGAEFEGEFRQLPPDAPPGALTRSARLMKAFATAP